MRTLINKRGYCWFLGLLLFVSCQKDVDEFVPDPGQPQWPDTTWYSATTSAMPVVLLKNDLSMDSRLDSVSLLGSIASVQLSPDAVLYIPINSLILSNGYPVTGKIFIESRDIRKKGHMIRIGTPTVSVDNVLNSNGEFYLRLFQGNEEISLMQGTHAYIRYNEPAPPEPLKVFNGTTNIAGVFSWLYNEDTLNNNASHPPGYQYCVLNTSEFGWVQSANYCDTTNARSVLQPELPSHFTNINTMAFVVINNTRSVINMQPNVQAKKFTASNIPSNEQVTLVVIARMGNEYYLGHSQVQTQNPSSTNVIQQVPVLPVKTTLDGIKNYLEVL